MNILIIGGSGGIGSALINLFLASQPEASVYATYRTRKPPIEDSRLHWVKLDVTVEQEVQALANSMTHVDILINTVGILQLPDCKPEKTINSFNTDFFNHNILSNVIPTIYLAKYFSSHLKSSANAFFISISARIGSIEDNNIGGWISYRCSKASLNMAIKTISIEWKHALPNCCVLAFHPGTTDTNLSKPFQRNVPSHKLFSADYVAHCLVTHLATTSPTDSGKFFSYCGSEIPW